MATLKQVSSTEHGKPSRSRAPSRKRVMSSRPVCSALPVPGPCHTSALRTHAQVAELSPQRVQTIIRFCRGQEVHG